MLPKNAHVVSYADNTYVSVSNENMDELRSSLNNTMQIHNEYLKSIGMVTNVNKTELTFFSRSEIQDTSPLVIGPDLVKPQNSIKVLGITFDQDQLSWKSHASKLKQRASPWP